MDLITAQNTFAVRLLDWSRRDFLRELEEGCPLPSTLGLNRRDMAAFVMWNEMLSSSQRKGLVLALTKRSHENAARLKGEIYTDVDEQWRWAKYEHTCLDYVQKHVPPLLTAFEDRPGFLPLDPEHCLSCLVEHLSRSPVLGKPTRRWSKVICTRKLNEWKIVTSFTMRGTRGYKRLSFDYQFIRKDGTAVAESHPAQGPYPRTLLFFYGLGFSEVRIPAHQDSAPMAKVMTNLAEYFVARADPLFEGLGIAD